MRDKKDCQSTRSVFGCRSRISIAAGPAESTAAAADDVCSECCVRLTGAVLMMVSVMMSASMRSEGREKPYRDPGAGRDVNIRVNMRERDIPVNIHVVRFPRL